MNDVETQTEAEPQDDETLRDLFSPNGKLIEGTDEMVPGTSKVDGFTREKGEWMPEHGGDTKLHWDGGYTQEADDGDILVVDEDGLSWPLTVCRPLTDEEEKTGQMVRAFNAGTRVQTQATLSNGYRRSIGRVLSYLKAGDAGNDEDVAIVKWTADGSEEAMSPRDLDIIPEDQLGPERRYRAALQRIIDECATGSEAEAIARDALGGSNG